MKKNLFENAKMELILFGSDVLTTSDNSISEPNGGFTTAMPGGITTETAVDKTYETSFNLF